MSQSEDILGVYGANQDEEGHLIDFAASENETSPVSIPPPIMPSPVPLTPTPAPAPTPPPSATPNTAQAATPSSSSESSTKSSSAHVTKSSSATMVPPPPPVPQSALSKVYLSSEAFRFCLTQCLSTEVEEVMGLLIGHVDVTDGHCHVTHSLPLKRLDKRKDRVEIGIEQLASSFSVVEQLTACRREQHKLLIGGDEPMEDDILSKQLSVVGWYHSHPHITVFPSEVDIATHHQYQSTMSPYWLGLIFGVFNYDEAHAANRFQLIAFQSVDNKVNGGRGLKHVVIPITIESRTSPVVDKWALEKAATLIDLLLEEEKEAFLINQGKPGGHSLAHHYNACVYSKAVAKIIALLGAPMIDVLNQTRELADRLNAIEFQ